METPILNRIQSPNDLKNLKENEMIALAAEIRSFLIESLDHTGGHLASNLGVVELTLALHRTFDFSRDHLIFDVGHQCYVHKMLTGRRERFDTLRQINGLSGFPKRAESEYDSFGTGHSSTSLSAALGFAESDHLNGSDAYTIAVIGDGAFTGGMIHEALNNCSADRRLIIILNENEMSISRNIGTFAAHIAKIRASERYYKTKNRTASLISHIPLIGHALFRAIRALKQCLKNMMYGSNLFEELGLYYLGPVDGNDYARVNLLLREAVAYGKSAVIHVHTCKGKGYLPAENQPSRFHGLAPKRDRNQPHTERFSEHLGKTLTRLAENNSSVCAITAAMGEATGLIPFREKWKDRYFDVGIAEEHALTFCAGMAAAGMRPFFTVYSSFLQRGYDNLIHDIALQKLPVTVCVDRAGLSAGDGPTHHGVFDVAFLSHIPEITIIEPATFTSMEQALSVALAEEKPCVIRYANGGEVIGSEMLLPQLEPLAPRADFTKDSAIRTVIITYGRLVKEAMAAKATLGDTCGVILLERLTPYAKLAEQLVSILPSTVDTILIAEEGVVSGGVGMNLQCALREISDFEKKRILTLGIENPFAPFAGETELFAAYGIDRQAMLAKIAEKV